MPIPTDQIPGHPLGDLICQTLPVEVQILTLEDYDIRNLNPDAQHESYKRRQFERIFPALFPKKIYAPLISSNE